MSLHPSIAVRQGKSVVEDHPATQSQTWAVYVGGYGAFLFAGTEAEAEQKRADKARWEHGVGRKRLATAQEIRDQTPSQEWRDYATQPKATS